MHQRRAEFRGVRVAAEQSEAVQLRPFIRQGLGLLVIEHLQAVFDMPQIAVGGLQVVGDRPAGAADHHQLFDGGTSPAQAQIGIAAAPDQLLGLREELDLADAAAPDLDVVAADRDLAMTFDGMDLPLDRVDILDGGEIEMLAPDERAQVPEEFVARRHVAGDDPRLDHRRALPVLPHSLVVGLRRNGRHGEWRGRGVGAKPEIDTEHISVLVRVLQQPHQTARQLHEALACGLLAAIDHTVEVEQDDQVDVAGIVELAGAELAEAKDDETAAQLRLSGMWQLQLAAVVGKAQQVRSGRAPPRRRRNRSGRG